MQHPIEILERYWNFTDFRPLQEDIINAVLEGEDTFALLPTGGGKSICFQIPALVKDGICIVISPLIALMKDQVQALLEKDIKAMALTSEYSYSDINRMLDNCIYGNYKFLYFSQSQSPFNFSLNTSMVSVFQISFLERLVLFCSLKFLLKSLVKANL